MCTRVFGCAGDAVSVRSIVAPPTSFVQRGCADTAAQRHARRSEASLHVLQCLGKGSHRARRSRESSVASTRGRHVGP